MTTYFLAGTMQGSRTGQGTVDQSYRRQLRELILARRPDAEVRDPAELMAGWLDADAAALRDGHHRLASTPVLSRATLDPAVRRLIGTFDDLVAVAGSSDVCVAWLPGHEASMGTAVEMWAAQRAGRRVVAITEMRQNLAVLACATHVVPGLADFDDLLGSGALDD